MALVASQDFIDEIADLVDTLGAAKARDVFVRSHAHPFLLRPPIEGALADQLPKPSMGFATTEIPPAQALQAAALGQLAVQWLVIELVKPKGAPFPERFSIGRATNSDIILLFPFVSKFHGYIKVADGGARLMDGGSANGFQINGEQVESRRPTMLAYGDEIGIGPLTLIFADAAVTFDRLLPVATDAE